MSEKKKVLLVDDDPDFVEAVKVIVESGGYDVRVAYDGKEGLEAVAEEKPDIIVLDVMMPGEDGLTLCRRLRAAGTFFGDRIGGALPRFPCWHDGGRTVLSLGS